MIRKRALVIVAFTGIIPLILLSLLCAGKEKRKVCQEKNGGTM
jgi:hypothetical protein